MTAAFTQRYIVSDVDSRYPRVLSPVTYLGSPPAGRKPSIFFEGLVPFTAAYTYGYRIFTLS
jgi:hypothetical protein